MKGIVHRITVAALLLCASTGARGETTEGAHGSVGLGVGLQYGIFGVRAEGGYGPWTAFFGIPLPALLGAVDLTHTFAGTFGVRWSPRGSSGPYVAAHAMLLVDRGQGSYDDSRETDLFFAANAGWRWAFGAFWAELALGPALTHSDYRFPSEDYGADSGRLVSRWRYGIALDGRDDTSWPLDVTLGFGFRF
jgi:hypothetical protein